MVSNSLLKETAFLLYITYCQNENKYQLSTPLMNVEVSGHLTVSRSVSKNLQPLALISLVYDLSIFGATRLSYSVQKLLTWFQNLYHPYQFRHGLTRNLQYKVYIDVGGNI